MIVFDILRTENHQVYRDLERQNLGRQYDFLRSAFLASMQLSFAGLSDAFLKALNMHAIGCLHEYAGSYRPVGIEVRIGESAHTPPISEQVPGLMSGLINDLNENWNKSDPIALSAYTLWRLNWIHPFVNGNGRTARAAAYYVICRKVGNWLPGTKILPELIRDSRSEYVGALQHADATSNSGQADLQPLMQYLTKLLSQQLSENGHAAGAEDFTPPPTAPPPP